MSAPGVLAACAALVLAIGLLAAVRAVLLAAMIDQAGGREATTLGFGFAVMDGVGALGAWFAGIAGSADLHHAFGLTAVMAVVTATLIAVHTFSRAGSSGLPEPAAA